MQRILAVLALTLGLWFFTPGYANAATSAEACSTLPGAKHAIMAIEGLRVDGIITDDQAKSGTSQCLTTIQNVTGNIYTSAEVLSISDTAPTPQKLTALQRFAGLVTLANTLMVFGVAIIAIGIYLFFGGAIRKMIEHFKSVPFVFYESMSYALSTGVIIGSWFTTQTLRPYLGLLGCLLLGAAALFSNKLKRSFAQSEAHVAWLLFASWTPTAIWYGSSMIGFISVGALLTALGFTGAMYPLAIAIGFTDEKGLGRATSAGFVMLTGFVVVRIFHLQNSVLQYFEFGALFLGSFVGYLGLLIASSKWYDGRRNYALFQVITITAGILAIVVGTTFQIGELLKIGGTFFVLYLLEKLFEIPSGRGMAFGVKLLAIGGVLFALASYITNHIDQLGRYLLFIS